MFSSDLKIKHKILWTVIESLHGKPYKWAGDDPMAGFDCNGAMQELYMSIDCDPPGDQTADAYFNYFMKHGVTKEVFGALVCFGTPSKVTHVGMYITENIMFEFGGGGSKTKTLQDAIDQNAYGRFRPISRRSDLVTIVAPLALI